MGPPPGASLPDAHDCIMVRIKRSYRIQVCSKTRSQWRAPLRSSADRYRPDSEAMQKAPLAVHHRSACSGLKALRNTSTARRHTAKLCYRFGPLTPSARSAKPDRRRRGEERLSHSDKEPATDQKQIPFAPPVSRLRTHLRYSAQDGPHERRDTRRRQPAR